MIGYTIHYDLTPTHYGIGSETPNLKPTGFKSKHLRPGSFSSLESSLSTQHYKVQCRAIFRQVTPRKGNVALMFIFSISICRVSARHAPPPASGRSGGTHAGTRAPMRALGHGPQSRVADTARRLTATHATNGIPLRHARASALQPAVRPLLSLSATAVVSALVSGLCRASHLGRSHSASLQQALLDHPTAPSRFTGTCVVPRV